MNFRYMYKPDKDEQRLGGPMLVANLKALLENYEDDMMIYISNDAVGLYPCMGFFTIVDDNKNQSICLTYKEEYREEIPLP